VVTPDGDTLFLEVNQMGQFLFVERMAGIPLLDAFCDFLIQGTPSFKWPRDRPEVLYDDILPEASAALEEASETHTPAPQKRLNEAGTDGAAGHDARR
jgi:hypothetical protein